MVILENLVVERWPVRNTAVHGPDMNEVEEVRGVSPFEACVIDHEFAVRGNEGGLDRGQVSADDLSGGELVGKITTVRFWSVLSVGPCTPIIPRSFNS